MIRQYDHGHDTPRAGEALAFLFIQGFYSTFLSQLSLFTEPNLCHDFARYAELGAWVATPGFFLYNLNDFGRFGCIACRIVFLVLRGHLDISTYLGGNVIYSAQYRRQKVRKMNLGIYIIACHSLLLLDCISSNHITLPIRLASKRHIILNTAMHVHA